MQKRFNLDIKVILKTEERWVIDIDPDLDLCTCASRHSDVKKFEFKEKLEQEAPRSWEHDPHPEL